MSTHIYCRPTCPARLARRANVSFYDLPEQAEAQGFRPCKRCRPESLEHDEYQQESRRAIDNACKIIQQQPQLSVQEVSKKVGLSTTYFYTAFRRVVGTTPGAYLRHTQQSQQKEPDYSWSPLDSAARQSSFEPSLSIGCNYEGFGLTANDQVSSLLAGDDGRERDTWVDNQSELSISNTEWLALHDG